jgi:LmbE family N-acetylglucosaminyl deacetylase
MAHKRVLVIMAHPDDEVLGCGATLALHAQRGDEVRAVIVCEGESLRYGRAGVGQARHIERSQAELGIARVEQLSFPDQTLDQTPLTKIISPLEAIIREMAPQVIYTHHAGDLNRDHVQVFSAAMVAALPFNASIEAILSAQVPSCTEWSYPRTFVPDTWVNVAETLDAKLRAMACYESELKPFPHPRSLEAISIHAKACGLQVCLEAAEAFMTVRRVCSNGQPPF